MNFFAARAYPAPAFSQSTRLIEGVLVDGSNRVSKTGFSLHYSDGTEIVHDCGTVKVQFRYSTKGTTLVCVELARSGVTPLDPLWSGVVGGKLIAKTPSHIFVQAPIGNKEPLVVFYPDGRVAVLKTLATNSQPFKSLVSAREAFKYRLDRISAKLAQAATLPKDEQAKCEDRNLHEVAAIVAMSKRHPMLRDDAIEFIIGRGKPLRPAVFEHLRQACVLADDVSAWHDLREFNDPLTVASVGSAPATRKGVPASEVKRKSDRQARDREARALMKGPPRSDDSNQHRGKKGKSK